jgi:O-antigen/teichoic acid export membrane protein
VLAGFSPLISRFLNLNNLLYPIIVFSTMLVVLALSVSLGVMQGLQRFFSLGFSQTLVGLLKLGFGALLVYLGLGIYGGLAAIPISFALVLLVTFPLLRNLSRAGNERVAVTGLRSYAVLTLVAIFFFTVLTNVDVILARHYLNATDAGNYSAISVLGRIAFYAPAGVAAAMFPKTSALFESGGDHQGLFLKAMLLVALIAGSVVLVYGLFAQMVIQFLFAGKYPLVAPYLFIYGLAMALFAFSFLLLNYFLSFNQTKVAYSLLAVVILQLTLIAIFHSTIGQLVNIMLICGMSSVVAMLPFYLRQRRKARRLTSGKGAE